MFYVVYAWLVSKEWIGFKVELSKAVMQMVVEILMACLLFCDIDAPVVRA
jgi:hypothetical protein